MLQSCLVTLRAVMADPSKEELDCAIETMTVGQQERAVAVKALRRLKASTDEETIKVYLALRHFTERVGKEKLDAALKKTRSRPPP